MKIRPTGDRVLVQRAEEERTTAGGIVLPGNATEKSMLGDVVAVGPGPLLDNGDRRALELKVGDKILFGKYAGTEVKIEGQDYMVMREEDIIGVIEG